MLSALLAHGHDIRALPAWRSPAALSCRAMAAGHEQRRAERYSWDGLRRGTEPFLVVQHTLLGEGRLDYAGTRYRLGPGQTMLVTMPHAHRYWLERGGAWEYFWLMLSGREALRLARAILDTAGPVLQPDGPQVDRLARACLTVMTAPRLTQGEASDAAHQAMTALHDAAFAAAPAEDAQAPAIARTLAFIEAHLADPLPVERLAGVAGMSRAHFVRQFTRAMGAPPSDVVARHRLERIERLLLATEMKVGEIARMTGFADGNYLAKVFRRHRGMTPLEFRATRAEAAS